MIIEYAKGLFLNNPVKYKLWVLRICSRLRDNQYESVLYELELYKEKRFKDCSANLYGYISNNKMNIY